MGVKPNSDYRENPERAIYLTGKIDQALVDRLTPKINELRLSSDQPITAYIDSSGGSVQHAEFIRRLVTAPNPDDRCCRLITVVTGTAASAEADFLSITRSKFTRKTMRRRNGLQNDPNRNCNLFGISWCHCAGFFNQMTSISIQRKPIGSAL